MSGVSLDLGPGSAGDHEKGKNPMATKKAPKVELTLDALTGKLDEIKAIDEKLSAAKGTAAEWAKRGREAAEATTLSDYIGTEPFVVSFTLMPDTAVGDHLALVKNYVSECEQFGNELMSAWIKANRKDSDESIALRERRDTLVEEAEAMRSIFLQMGAAFGIEAADVPEVPKAVKRSSGSSGGATGGSKTATLRFYKKVNGETIDQPDTQNSLSSCGWYYFGKAKVSDLRAALASQHGHVDETKDWEGEVECNGKKVTFGWRVIAPEAAPADEPSEAQHDEGDDEPEA